MTLPDKLTAAEFERLKAQEQRMLNSGSWVPQSEDRLTAQVNAAAADSAAPDSMTAEQADVAEARQSVMAETQFGRSVGIRPDYSQPPAKDPAEDEPKTIGDLRKRQQDLYNDPSYDMPFEEWQDFTRWQKQNESEVGSFIGGLPGMAQSLGQLGVGLVKERAQQAYRATAGLDPIGAAATEVATFKEMGRKIGVGLTQLSDWVGGKVNDIVESGRRVGQVQQNVIRALRDSGQLTGDPIQDNTTIQKALEEAAAQGMYEPTQQQAEEDEEVGYQRYQRKKAYDREYAGITEFSIGGNRMTLPDVKETVTMPTLLPNTEQSKGVNVERQVFQPQEATATVGAMAFSPENALPIGVGVLARARMLRRLASVTGTPLRATETAMASVDDWLARTADRVTSKVPFVGDLPLNQRAYALGAAGGVGAYLDATTDSPVIDVIAKPLIVAGLVLPAAKAAGGTIRRVGAGAGAGWQVIKEMDAGAVGSARAETAARMAASGKFNPRYSKYMERGAQGGVESTLRRVSQNPEMPETLRRIARSADNIGITQVARGIDDAVSSSVAAGIAATPFALVAPDSETAGGIVGGAVLLGGTLGTAGRVIGRRSARTDADIARMMVDVEMAGGDAGSLGALSYSGLDLLAAMQGITSGKVDFVPLRAQEYRANADVRASGGETVAGLHIEKAADGRAKVYVNMGHTAPIAGRVSIKPIQITRNGKTEDANVVRIKGADGESDFTVVPREYPLLVKSGDIVEPNARLARGLSPTHVMPHEIGHAILTSSILNGSIRDDLRNLVNQRYDTAGVEARGREYVTRIVDKDILAGAHDQLPDKLTQQEFDDIASGKRTMADVLKGKPVSDAQREQMITDRYNEMRERSIAEGNNPDGLDVFRDEIVAETFSSLSDSLDFRRMRAGGPQVMESVLAATARVFETMGVKFDRSTGKLMDNPSVVFRDNPLMQDPIMRKRMQEHLRNYEAWMLGMEQAGAREQKGTQISVDGSAESARRSTHTKLRANDNGVLENDLIYIDQNGQAQWKPQKMLDEQEKGRSAQVGQLYDKNKILPPNSAEFGLRRAGVGRTVISGPTLPAKFDVLRWFPKHIREMARMLEAGREGGASHIFDYNTIGTGEGGRYRVINRGDVRAIIREGAFLGWEATKNGHLKAVVMDLNAFRSAAMRAINRGELGIFNNDMGQLQADLMVYLANHKNGLPGEATIGQQKRDMLNGLIGTGTAVQRDINPLYADLNPRGSVRSFRFDRINDITPTGRDGYHFDYDKIKNNRMPQALPREAMGMPDADANTTGAQSTDDAISPAMSNYRGTHQAGFGERGDIQTLVSHSVPMQMPGEYALAIVDGLQDEFAFRHGQGFVAVISDTSHRFWSRISSHMFRLFQKEIGKEVLPPNTFIRVTNQKEDYAHIKKGTHRGSRNHGLNQFDNTDPSEGGLSVAYDFEHGAKYAYLVTGEIATIGTDGEPVLALKSVKPASQLMPYEKLVNKLNIPPVPRRESARFYFSNSKKSIPHQFGGVKERPDLKPIPIDTEVARGQAMPDITITPDEARRRGLVGPVYHGSPDFKGRKFDPKYRARSSGLSRGGFSFTDDVASADGYAAAPIDSAQAAVDSANDVMREAAGRMERGLKIKGFSAPDELPEFNVRYVDDISELSSYFNELAKDMPKDLAARLRDAAKQVNEPANPVVVEAYLRNPKTMDIDGKKLWLVENSDDIFVSAARPPQGAATGRTRGQAMPDVADAGDQGVAMPKGTVTQLTNTARKALPKLPQGAKSVPKLVIKRIEKSDIVVDGGNPKSWKDYADQHLMPLPNIKLDKVKGVSFSKQDIYDVAQTDRARAQANAQQSVQAAALAAADPLKFVDPVGYSEIMRASGVVGDILIPPSGLKLMLTDPAAFVGLLDGGFHGKRTVPGTRAAAMQGLDGVTEMRQLVGGQPSSFNTALHHFWGTLSKQLDVINQEAAWMRLVLDPAIIEAIDLSINGNFSMLQKDWEALVTKALDGTQGDFRSKGNNAKSNANSFYKALVYHNGRWDEVAALYANNNAIDMRAQFNALGHGKVGMKNKVQGFVGLSFGIKGSVLDRWRFVDLYLPDVMSLTGASTPEQYFKYVGAQKVIPQDPIGIYKNYGTLENGNPAFSLALYNSLDSVAQVAINNSPELRNYLGAHADPGGLHWVTWNSIKNEAVGHSSLDITKNFVRQYGRNGTASDFAKFMRTAEGFVEGSNDAGQTIRLSLKNGVFSYSEQ